MQLFDRDRVDLQGSPEVCNFLGKWVVLCFKGVYKVFGIYVVVLRSILMERNVLFIIIV